jgi:Holliday junction DNA helicase RuvB
VQQTTSPEWFVAPKAWPITFTGRDKVGWFSKKRLPVREITLGDKLDVTQRIVERHVSVFPAEGWLKKYQEEIRQEHLALEQDWLDYDDGEDVTFPPTPLIFDPQQPDCFYEGEGRKPYRGQDHAKEVIDVKLAALYKPKGPERVKCILTGPAGIGKTAFAWIAADRIRRRQLEAGRRVGDFYEILPQQIEQKKDMDALMEGLQDGDIVFVDEVHVLKRLIGGEVLYNVLADGAAARYPLSDGAGWINIPGTVSWITATTDPGDLNDDNGGALSRRLQPEIEMQVPSLEILADILHDQDVPVDKAAAKDMATRSGGLPWQVLLIYEQAKAVTLAEGQEQITSRHANRAFRMMGLDERGLFPKDRRVIRELLSVKQVVGRGANARTVHRMSEDNLLARAGIDRMTFKKEVQPKLLRFGYLTTGGGQTLTDKALGDYGHLAKP